MKRILCYGDSNTFGHDPKDGRRLTVRWPKVLSEKLGPSFEIIEAGLCGRTTALDDPYTEGMNGEKLLVPTLWSAQPYNLVILMLGTNDLQPKHDQSAADIAANVDRLVETILAHGECFYENPQKVLLISPIHLHPKIGEMPVGEIFGGQESYEKSLALSPLLEAAAKKRGAFFLDAARFASPSETDGLHMDEESHRALGEAVYQKVKEIFS